VLARILRYSSLICCAIVLVSFSLFAIDQAGAASKDSQAGISGQQAGSKPAPSGGDEQPRDSGHGRVRTAIDDADHNLVSPFAGLANGSSSDWVRRGVPLLVALLVYGFGLGYLSRFAAGRA
jgi:hypothetical protein